jgi:hypothetical protein
MNTKILKITTVAVVALLVLGALGLGVAYAQTTNPDNPFTPRGMMGGYLSRQGDSGWMTDMHIWMHASGGMHNSMWDSLANAYGLTTDELYAELDGGKSLAELADERGLERTALVAELENAHQAGLNQAVSDGILTQEQADAMFSQMDGRYEWMLDNMGSGAGFGMMGGYGGMMGRHLGQQGGSGLFASGGCHGNFSGQVQSAPQNTP